MDLDSTMKIVESEPEDYLDDGYLGSGKHLKRAISKYGENSFTKEILFIFDNQRSRKPED